MSSILSIKNAEDGAFAGGGGSGGSGTDYKAGDGISINDDIISVKYDSKSLTLNNEQELSVIPYTAGNGISIYNKRISTTPYTAGDGINIQDKSISAIPYTGGDGINIQNRTISATPYTAGTAIDIRNKNVSVRVDDNTIKIDESNRLYANTADADPIWECEYICPRDFYKNFTNSTVDEESLTTSAKPNFDITQEMFIAMPQMPEHIFDFTFTNPDGSVVNFYFAVDYNTKWKQYGLLKPNFNVDSNHNISIEQYILLDGAKRPAIWFLQSTFYKWMDLVNSGKLTVEVNPNWIGIVSEYVGLVSNYDSKTVKVQQLQANNLNSDTLKANTVQANELSVEDVVLYKDEGEKPYQFKEKSFTQFLDDGYNILYLNDLPNPDDSRNYLIRTTGKNDVELEVFKFVLPDEMQDSNTHQSIGNVICYYLGDGKWKMPFISVSGGLFSVEYRERTEGVGIAIQYYYTPPLNLFLQGKLKPEYMLVIDAVATAGALKCDIVECKNTLKYYESPLPYLYKPKALGEKTVSLLATNGNTVEFECWFIDFGYYIDTEEFDDLYEHQMFSYQEGVFGNSYYLEKENDAWIGNNFSIHGLNSINTEKIDYSGDAQVIFELLLPIDDCRRSLIKYLCGGDSTVLENNWFNWLKTKITSYTYEDERHTKDLSALLTSSSFGTKNVNGVQCYYMSKDEGYAGKSLRDKLGTLVYNLGTSSSDYKYYWDNNRTGKITINFNFGKIYENDKSETTAYITFITELGQFMHVNDGPSIFIRPANRYIILSFCFDAKSMVSYSDTQGLSLYMDKYAIWKINDNNYSSGNTFGFISSVYNYSIAPQPNACSSLYTEHNLISERIVVGENVETHAFTLNDVGNNVDVMMNQIVAILQEIQYIEEYLQALAEAIQGLSEMFNLYIMLDAAASLFEGLFTITRFAINGAIKFGEKVGMKGGQLGLEIGETSFKTEIKSAETSVNKLTATSIEAEKIAGKAGSSLKLGENAAKTELKSAETTAAKFTCEEFEAVGVATDTIKPKTTTSGSKAAVKIPRQKTANLSVTKGAKETEMDSEVINIFCNENECVFDIADNSTVVYKSFDDMIAEVSYTGVSCKAVGTNEVKCMANQGALLKMEPARAVIKSNSKTNPTAISNIVIDDAGLELRAASAEGPLVSMSSAGGVPNVVIKSNSKANADAFLQCTIEDTGLKVADEKGSILKTLKNAGNEVEIWYDRVVKFNNYVEAGTLVWRAMKASAKGERYSASGIEVDYDEDHENPDLHSTITIKAGTIELATLNNQITVFGNSYKGIVDMNDSTTWTKEYICDGSVIKSLVERIKAIETRLGIQS